MCDGCQVPGHAVHVQWRGPHSPDRALRTCGVPSWQLARTSCPNTLRSLMGSMPWVWGPRSRAGLIEGAHKVRVSGCMSLAAYVSCA
jgi:hypothetical protein